MPILFSDAFAKVVRDEPIVYLDAGARGGLEGPWGQIKDDRLSVIAFEPESEACDTLGGGGPSWRVVPKALWSNSGVLPVHLAKVRPTSSVHPPNQAVLERYRACHGDPRDTEAVIQVPCVSIDEAISELSLTPDFLKIDTQGAEYEILQGARHTLESCLFGVITETWTTEVHAGQKLTGDILTLMHERGFSLFDLTVAAAWQRRSVDTRPVNGKGQVTGLDLLFLREPASFVATCASIARRVKAAAIAELYGFPDVALDLLETCPASSEIAAMQRDILGATNIERAKLHY